MGKMGMAAGREQFLQGGEQFSIFYSAHPIQLLAPLASHFYFFHAF